MLPSVRPEATGGRALNIGPSATDPRLRGASPRIGLPTRCPLNGPTFIIYSDRYHIESGPHVLPTLKHRPIRDRLVETGVFAAADVLEPAPASWSELALVHTPEYLAKLREGAMTDDEIAQLELPW